MTCVSVERVCVYIYTIREFVLNHTKMTMASEANRATIHSLKI